MTLEECYVRLNGDYATAKVRLMNDSILDRFVRKFINDPSMGQLCDAVANNDRNAAFAAVHTLKGVAANLSFTELQQKASALTEQLRNGDQDPDKDLFNAVEEAYNKVISAVKEYMS